MSPADVRAGKSALPCGVTCDDCAAVGWSDCGTVRDFYCVASDRGPFDDTPATVQGDLW